jgi:formylmethanofuran dehydrogenase subunit E
MPRYLVKTSMGYAGTDGQSEEEYDGTAEELIQETYEQLCEKISVSVMLIEEEPFDATTLTTEEVQAIGYEIGEQSIGSHNISYDEKYDALSVEQRIIAHEAIDEVAYPCDDCGWIEDATSLENFPDAGATVCWRCAETRYEEENEEE